MQLKGVVRWKLIALNACIRKEERLRGNELNIQLKKE